MTTAPMSEIVKETANDALPRLLPLVPGVPEDLRAHLARYGRPPYRGGPGMLT